MADSDAKQGAEAIVAGLKAPLKLHREAALQNLSKCVQTAGEADLQAFLAALRPLVLQLPSSDVWQHRLGGFDAAKVLIPLEPVDTGFFASVLAACQDHLEDEEPRVRAAVGDCLLGLARQQGTAIFDAMAQQILDSIRAAFARDPVETQNGGDGCVDGGAEAGPDFLGRLLQTSYRQQRPGQGELRHDTEGWRSLESSFRALQALMEGCGPACLPHVTADVRQLILDALLHQNRFVRERGYRVVVALLGVCDESTLHALAPELARRLADGLNDSWSHVQYAASEATRALLAAAHPQEEAAVLPVLLPAMCFNRHVSAEGLRTYSQATWERAMGNSGRAWVARCIAQVVEYYMKQARSGTTEKREAACECMSELAAKIDAAAVGPHIGPMLRCLVGCFRDASWPVREAACEACGQFALAFPDTTRSLLPQLWPLWLEHLGEAVPSVRETAACALGNAVRAFGDDAVQTVVLPQAQAMLRKVEEQPADKSDFVQTAYGVAAVRPNETLRSNSDDDAALFGSPPPDPVTYRKGDRPARLFSTSALSREPASCCMDDGFTRERQAWESADGAVYLVRELAAAAPDATMNVLMPALADAVRHEHYAHSCHFQETTWRQLPLIAQHLGKRGFKRYLEPFMEPLFRSVQSAAHQGCQSAAITAAGFLRDWLGPRIWAGRLSPEQQALMRQFVPTVVRNNKACYVAEYAKPGFSGGTPGLAH